MSIPKSIAVSASATGVMTDGPATVRALGIKAGADAATVKFYDSATTANSPLRWSLGVAANTSDGLSFTEGLRFTEGIWIVVTGTTPDVHIAIEYPQANQLNP